jgi:hypothetical protein
VEDPDVRLATGSYFITVLLIDTWLGWTRRMQICSPYSSDQARGSEAWLSTGSCKPAGRQPSAAGNITNHKQLTILVRVINSTIRDMYLEQVSKSSRISKKDDPNHRFPGIDNHYANLMVCFPPKNVERPLVSS